MIEMWILIFKPESLNEPQLTHNRWQMKQALLAEKVSSKMRLCNVTIRLHGLSNFVDCTPPVVGDHSNVPAQHKQFFR